MGEGDQEAVRAAYTFADKLDEHVQSPKFALIEGSAASSAWWLRTVLTVCANVVHAFAETLEVELGDPEPGDDASSFMECAECNAQPGSPALCESCLHNRQVIEGLTGRMQGRGRVGMPRKPPEAEQ